MTTPERLWRQFNKALGQYQLIDEDDRILVGLSGGKDSLCLVELLARRSRILRPHFTVEAIHVRMENIRYETDSDYLRDFCSSQGVPLHIVTTRFEPAPPPRAEGADTRPGKSKPACFLCSWQRRKQLFDLAQRRGCAKIALGHHQDDIILTALMNLTFQGHFSTMPARLSMRKMPLTIIRPLCLCREEDIRQYAELRQYRKLTKLCPYETATNRTSVRQLLGQMEHLNPEARHSLWNAIESANLL